MRWACSTPSSPQAFTWSVGGIDLLKKNLLASYSTQAYLSLIGLLMMPIYLRLMGAEAFGLIGIFLMVQAWVQLLDLGLTPTFSRELSRFHAGALQAGEVWGLVRNMEWVLGGLALAFVLAFVALRQWIATRWLSPVVIPVGDVAWCLVAMAVSASLRWLMGLYRAGLIGMERQFWVNAASVALTTLRFVGVVPLLWWVSPSPLAFFAFQLVAGLLEFLLFRRELYRVIPGAPATLTPRLDSLRAIIPMAGAMAFMGGMWIFQTQIDKLILSKVLALPAYGHFTLAVMAASAVLMLMPPLSQVLQPRLTILAAQGKHEDLRNLYSVTTQFVTVLFGALGVTMAWFALPLLRAWTGDAEASLAAAPILVWYGLANALVGLLVLPFMLQFAYGRLRLHVVGNVGMALTLFPVLIYMSIERGAVGAGETLFFANLLYLLLWVPLVHQKMLPREHWAWLLRDIAPVAMAVLAAVSLVSWVTPEPGSRWASAMLALAAFGISAVCGLLAGNRSRSMMFAILRKTP